MSINRACLAVLMRKAKIFKKENCIQIYALINSAMSLPKFLVTDALGKSVVWISFCKAVM
jgi:hypothetical protein